MHVQVLHDALARRYPPPEWFLCEEVTVPGGRRIDVVGFNLWASRGHRLLAFELKVDRRDWLRELREPQKADRIASVVDEFWLVTASNVVKPDEDEFPQPWGWLELSEAGKRFTVKQKPKALAHDGTLPRWLAGRLCDRVHRGVTPVQLREEFEKGRREGIEAEQRIKSSREKRLDELTALVDEFERKSGLYLRTWNVGDVSAAVRILTSGDHGLGAVGSVRRQIKEQADRLAQVIEGLEQIEQVRKESTE